MKNLISLILTLILFIGCSNNDDNIDNNKRHIDINELSYTLRLKNDTTDVVYNQEYTFENENVISEKYTNYNNPEFSHFSTFEYDENNRIVKEIRNDEIYREIIWIDNIAKVYDNQNQLISEFEFTNSLILNYKLYEMNGIRIKTYNYDSNNNIISISDENEVFVEFLDYQPIINPFSLINSIGILRLDYKPHFKNVFRTKKVYPFEGDDFSRPLSFYNYKWTLDQDQLIHTMENEESLIYTSIFEYN
jgi:uncharacterized protein YcfL